VGDFDVDPVSLRIQLLQTPELFFDVLPETFADLRAAALYDNVNAVKTLDLINTLGTVHASLLSPSRLLPGSGLGSDHSAVS
jgi:hypothetical protein